MSQPKPIHLAAMLLILIGSYVFVLPLLDGHTTAYAEVPVRQASSFDGFNRPQAEQRIKQEITFAQPTLVQPTSVPTPEPLTFVSSITVPYGTSVLWTGVKDESARTLQVDNGAPPSVTFAYYGGQEAVSMDIHQVTPYTWDTAAYVGDVMFGIISITVNPDTVTLQVTEGAFSIAPALPPPVYITVEKLVYVQVEVPVEVPVPMPEQPSIQSIPQAPQQVLVPKLQAIPVDEYNQQHPEAPVPTLVLCQPDTQDARCID